MEITATLARFVSQSRWEDIPVPVRHEGRRTLLNFFACALGGCRDEALERALPVLREFSGPKQATLIGRAEKLDMLSAAFINGAAANVHDFDDTHLPTVIHPAAPVVPAVLSLCENVPVTGKQFLEAVILGIEVECRIGNAVSPWHYSRGWHITSTCGVIGAAVAASKILHLDEKRIVHAIGLAANQSHGLIEALGTMGKSVSVGNAPRNGLFSAFLARNGYLTSEQTLEGPRGFASVFGHDADLPKITAGLGQQWEAAKNMYKPYPCGIVLHPAIDAFLSLRNDVSPDRVGRILVKANPLLRQRTDRPRPRSGREAQVSLQHAAAVCFLDGAAGLRQFSDARAADPAVQAFGAQVEIENDDGMPVDGVDVAVSLKDKTVLKKSVRGGLGSLADPMTDAQLEAKARGLAGPDIKIDALLSAVWNIETLPDAVSLAQLTAPPVSR